MGAICRLSRSALKLCLLLLVAAPLSACVNWTQNTGLPHIFDVSRPFEGRDRNVLAMRGITRGASIRLTAVSGLPPDQASALAEAVRDAAQARDVPLLLSSGAATAERLTGRASLEEGPQGVLLSLNWALVTPDDRLLDHFQVTTPLEAMNISRGGVLDLWGRISPRVIADAAERTAQGLRDVMEMAQGRTPGRTVTRRTILLLPVTGAPGDGRVTLSAALADLLNENGFPVETLWDGTLPEPVPTDALIVVGQIDMGRNRPQPGTDQIRMTWSVRDHRGTLIGQVSQANAVPHGSLDGPWRETAYFAAEGAAIGILNLLSRPVAPPPPPGTQELQEPQLRLAP